MDKIAAVVVTYNRKELLLGCIEAILHQTHVPDEIIVIDNASTDGTEDIIPTNPIITYIRMTTNSGGAGGFHEGMKQAYENGYDYIWIMDDDVIPDRNCLMHLCEVARQNSDAMIVSPIKHYKEGYYQGGTLYRNLNNPFAMREHYLGFEDSNQLQAYYPRIICVDDIPFEGPLIKREAITKAGLPFRNFFFQGDDAEYSLRVKRVGKLIVSLDARIERILPLTKFNANKLYFWCRNFIVIDMVYGKTTLVKKLRPIIRMCWSLLKSIKYREWYFIKLFWKSYVDAIPLAKLIMDEKGFGI